MLTIEEALALLGAVGTDNSPTLEQLQECRAALLSAAKVAREKSDRPALAAMLEAIKVSDLAIGEAEKLAAKEAEELDALVADFPELAGEELEAETPKNESEDTGRVLSVTEAVARLGLGAQAPRVEVNEPEPMQTLTINGVESNDSSWSNMGEAFAKFTNNNRRDGRSTIATFRTEHANHLSGKPGENTRVLDTLARQASDEAVIAAGGCCSLAEPIRDQPMLASLARPIADALPTVGTTAGRVEFYAPICLPQGGVGTWTCTQDENVDADDPETWKQCDEVECAESQEVVVEAIYRCLTIGNFQQRFSGERWDAILHAATAAQARLAEQTLFAHIRDSELTTSHTVTDTGSVYATTVNAFLRAAAIIRQTQRYVGIRIKAILPAWVNDAAKLDQAARAIARGRQIEADDLETVLARSGVDVIWSDDINPFDEPGAEGSPLLDFPDTFDAVVFVDGGVFRLDGGEINLGTEIRDHDLNRQNKLAAFAESFEAGVVRSCDTKHLTIPVTVCDEAPCVTQFVIEAPEVEG